MLKSFATAVAAAAILVPCLIQAGEADAFDKGMNTMWEVLWHQAGTPTRLVRWEEDLRVRVHGTNAAAHRQHTLKALRDTAAETGRKVIDVSDAPDAAQLANVSIEIVPNHKLSEEQPCETRLNFQQETKLDYVTMQMREAEAYRCAYHEAMHVMGVRGHPEGDTVLSYFTDKVDGLQPLDKAMLRAWYSPRARGGMTPFEVMPILADELVKILPNKQLAMQAKDRFFKATIEDMRAFADGRGDVPAIVKRSGKSTAQGIRFGRVEVSYFLGVAYQEGAMVQRDPNQANEWLLRAANQGSRSAQVRLGAGRAQRS